MRRRLFVLVVVCLDLALAVPAWAQAPREKVDLEIVKKIKQEGLERSQVMETISSLTDVHGPRLTGSPLTRTAGQWTQAKLTSWGLSNAHLEPWGPFGRGWTLEGFAANMVEPNFSPLIAFPKAWSSSTPKTVRGTPVYFDAAKEEDLEKFRGKLHRAIVLLGAPREVKALFDPPARRQTDEALLALANADIFSSRPRSSQTTGSNSGRPATGTQQRSELQLQSKKWQMIYDEGAAVVLEPGRGDGGTLFVGAATLPTRASSSPEKSAAPAASAPSNSSRPSVWAKDAPEVVPQVVVAVEHYNRLVRMLKQDAPVELAIDIACKYHDEDPMSFNIVAEIPGSDLKDEVVMLGAHFDSWHAGTGATDNAVGCGVALEAVRILRAIEAKPRRTIRLALWTGEEQGLFGSKAYVAEHFGKAITPPRTNIAKPESAAKPASGGEDEKEKKAPESEANKPAANPTPADAAAKSEAANPSRRPTRYELKPEHEKLSAYFNLDNGTGKVRGIYLQNNEAARPIFRAWLAPFADLDASTVSLANTGGTDHLSFDAIGLPGFQFIQDPLEYNTRTHHSSMDVYDRVQADDMKQASIIMASFVYHAAMRDEKLPRKPLSGEVIRAAEKREAD